MKLAAYMLVVSIGYAVLALVAPRLSSALMILFVALLLGPAVLHDARRWTQRRNGGR